MQTVPVKFREIFNKLPKKLNKFWEFLIKFPKLRIQLRC